MIPNGPARADRRPGTKRLPGWSNAGKATIRPIARASSIASWGLISDPAGIAADDLCSGAKRGQVLRKALFGQRALAVGQAPHERLARVERGAPQRVLAERLDLRFQRWPGPRKKGGDGTTMAVCPKIL